MVKRFIRYYFRFFLLKKKKNDWNENPIGPGNWNAPDNFGGEHNRLKKDINKTVGKIKNTRFGINLFILLE